eukprot:10522008-Alexandrium_andersonii.AAC.1
MAPGVSMPGARANRASAANWGRTSFPLRPATLQALQVLMPPAAPPVASPAAPVYQGQAPDAEAPPPAPMA